MSEGYFCVNCVHCEETVGAVGYICGRTRILGEPDLVTGNRPVIRPARSCRIERSDKGECGHHGEYWEPIAESVS